jgi:hypothetical protein
MKKNGVVSSVLFVLLAVVSVTALPAAPRPLAVADAPAAVETSELLCTLSQVAVPELPGSSPDPNPVVDICGACSGQCSNRNVGASCWGAYNPTGGFNGGWGWCLEPTVSTCSDGRPFCQCMTEYP